MMGINSQKQLTNILEHFNLPQLAYTFSALHIGYINDTYLVSFDDRPEYILQRINHGVFEDIDGLMGNIDHALGHLISDDYRKVELIRTLSNKTYWSEAAGYWRIMTYIENSTTYNTTTSPEIAFEAGRIISTFHTLLESANKEQYVDTIPDFHSLDLREEQFKKALSTSTTEKKEVASRAISFANEMLLHLKTMAPKELPIRICHNDTKFNNILFSKETQEALCLIDLDTLMKGYFHYDFGDAVRTIVNTAPEDEQDHNKITFEKDLFEAFIKGLADNNPFLTAEEIKALPYGALLLPFLHGIRALTDYLNGNIYYKVSYENQNLDRCLSLFDFNNKAFNEVDYMTKVVSNLLHPTFSS